MLAVDARWMVGEYRGMGRYAHALLAPVVGTACALLPEKFPQAAYPSIHHGNGFFPWWEQVILPRLCAERGVSRLLCPYNTAPIRLPSSTELFLVVHDLIYLESWKRLPPSVSAYQTLGRIYRRCIVPIAIQRASRIVTVSEYTRDQISLKFPIPKDDIHVIPNSLDKKWYSDSPLPLEKRLPYLLVVAGEAPSKNVPALISAFAQFRKGLRSSASDISLRIVGIKLAHQSPFRLLAKAAGIDGCTYFEPYLDECALRQLYREAWLFAMPSLFEGFGIPLLEAMASGTPVACSNTTSLPEVVGDAGWLFDPRDVDDMAGQLHEAWTDRSGRAERARLGLRRARLYHRDAVAASIANFWTAA